MSIKKVQELEPEHVRIEIGLTEIKWFTGMEFSWKIKVLIVNLGDESVLFDNTVDCWFQELDGKLETFWDVDKFGTLDELLVVNVGLIAEEIEKELKKIAYFVNQ